MATDSVLRDHDSRGCRAVYLSVGVPLALLIASATLTERFHADEIAAKLGGPTEVVLLDPSRVDVLTDQWAIEVDWAPKWAESIGQSLYYAQATDREPVAILLVGRSDSDSVYWLRAKAASASAGVHVWTYNVVTGELRR